MRKTYLLEVLASDGRTVMASEVRHTTLGGARRRAYFLARPLLGAPPYAKISWRVTECASNS